LELERVDTGVTLCDVVEVGVEREAENSTERSTIFEPLFIASTKDLGSDGEG
tara:strand:- start:459 stop:614 length:156 start_codon:yes stop_codon:yes gene_type:complete